MCIETTTSYEIFEPLDFFKAPAKRVLSVHEEIYAARRIVTE